jgi:hypothetical protein
MRAARRNDRDIDDSDIDVTHTDVSTGAEQK